MIILMTESTKKTNKPINLIHNNMAAAYGQSRLQKDRNQDEALLTMAKAGKTRLCLTAKKQV